MELGDTFGDLLIGIFIAAILFGVTNLQVFIYFRSYSNDPAWKKFSVCYLWVLDALQLALSFHVAYWNLIVNYFNPPSLSRLLWSFKAQDVVAAVAISSVQTLYAIRVWSLDKAVNRGTRIRGVMPITVAILTCAGYAASIVLCYEITSFKSDSILGLLGEKWMMYYPLSTWVSVDMAIAGCMSFLLFRCRTGFRRTDSMITVLMLYTLSTGIITSLCSLLAIATTAVLPKIFISGALEFSLTKLYVNSFMAMLNARNSIIRNPKTNTPEEIIFPTLSSLPSSSTDNCEPPKLVPSNCLQNELGSTIINDIPTSPYLPTTNMHRTEDTRFHQRNAQVPDELHVLGRVDHQSSIEHANTASTWAKSEPLQSGVV